MIFNSYDSKKECECETDIRIADQDTVELFVQTWVSDFLVRTLRKPDFSYPFFPWDKIIKKSFFAEYRLECFGAFTQERLDGLLCLGKYEDNLRIEFIGTAPWNYGENGKMRRIGSGLVYFAIKKSLSYDLHGTFKLNALPDAEKFYFDIGMDHTGNINSEGLREFSMSEKKAKTFSKRFYNYVTIENIIYSNRRS